MKNKILTTLLLCSTLYGLQTKEKIELKWLKTKTTSYVKDFYIWRYLDQDITPNQAKEAISQVRRLNNKIFYRYVNKADDKILKDYKSCMRAKTKDIIYKKPYCIEAGLSVYDATTLNHNQRVLVLNKLAHSPYHNLEQKIKIIDAKIPFDKVQHIPNKIFFDTFNQAGGKFRVKYFNHTFSIRLLNKLKKDKKFRQTIKLIVTNPKMKIAQISLLKLNSKGLDFKTTFHLAINAIKYKKTKLALTYLNDAYPKAYYRMQQDNITFWQYQLTKKQKYLNILLDSWDLNIYSLYALNKVGKKSKNIEFDIIKKYKKTEYDLTDPFEWLKVLDDTKQMTKEKLTKYQNIFTTTQTQGHLAFVSERFYKYKVAYFPEPYEDDKENTKKNMHAFIYAIARQESRFIPTSISSSYAMGSMQIMPFLSKALAKQLKEKYDIDQQFDPKTNVRYAHHHLKYLKRVVKNPLFMAYAYNGGIGFTKRLLNENIFKKGVYEPYLSMELVSYDESKKYGKKVLANYYIYQHHINPQHPISFDKMINSIAR